MEVSRILTEISKFIFKNGPNECEFDEMSILVNELAQQLRENKLAHEEFQRLKDDCNFLKDPSSIMGHIIAKPYGYTGDFHIIDRIYTNNTSERFTAWDKFSLSSSAAQAVKNRKDYFKEKITAHMPTGGTLLNIASGPARDLYELYEEHPGLNLITTCVEMDRKAIE